MNRVAATPDKPSRAESATAMLVPSALVVGVAVVVGGVLSIFTAGLDVALELELPARSLTAAVNVWPTPSLEIVESAQAPAANPDPPVSVHVQATVTSALYQPAAFALPTGAPLIVGAFLSTLTTTFVVPVLPAKSTPVPVTV